MSLGDGSFSVGHPYPIRQRSAQVPKPGTSIERTCDGCDASFLGLAPAKTRERGVWHDWRWYCSIECTPADVAHLLGLSIDPQPRANGAGDDVKDGLT